MFGPMVEVWGSLEHALLSQEVGFEELKVVESDVEREPEAEVMVCCLLITL